MIDNKYFKYAFASSGEVLPIPDDTQVGGSISYQQGYGPAYAIPKGEPGYLPVPRTSTNQLYLDITLALQQYQKWGIPNYITPEQYGTPLLPVPCPYPKFAFALYDDGSNGVRAYQSLVDDNIALPSDASKWAVCDLFNQSPVYNNATFNNSPIVVDGDMVYWDSVNSWFSKAQAITTDAIRVVGVADVTNARVYLSGYVSLFSGLTAGAIYYLSTSTPGAITAIAPLSNSVRIGVALSSTELLVNIVPLQSVVAAYSQVSYAATQSIGTTAVKVNFDTVSVGDDPNGWWDPLNFRMFPGQPGRYEVHGTLMGSSVVPLNFLFFVYVNGVYTATLSEVPINPATTICQPYSRSVNLTSPSDYIEIFAKTNTATFTLGGDVTKTIFQLEYLGPLAS